MKKRTANGLISLITTICFVCVFLFYALVLWQRQTVEFDDIIFKDDRFAQRVETVLRYSS